MPKPQQPCRTPTECTTATTPTPTAPPISAKHDSPRPDKPTAMAVQPQPAPLTPPGSASPLPQAQQKGWAGRSLRVADSSGDCGEGGLPPFSLPNDGAPIGYDDSDGGLRIPKQKGRQLHGQQGIHQSKSAAAAAAVAFQNWMARESRVPSFPGPLSASSSIGMCSQGMARLMGARRCNLEQGWGGSVDKISSINSWVSGDSLSAAALWTSFRV